MDRKTSLLSRLQYPVSLKSSTIDLLPGACLLQSRVVQGLAAYRYSRNARASGSSRSSVDSGLEAFSHYPALDSFAALPYQATALPIK